MTDTTFYQDMFNLATELMNDFGTPATLRKVTRPKPDAEGKSVPTTVDYPGLAVRISDLEVLRALELPGGLGYAVKFPADIQEGDQLIHTNANDTYEILQSKVVNPEGNRVMIAFVTVKRT